MINAKNTFFIPALISAILLTSITPIQAFQLTPPRNIVHKQKLPVKDLYFIRTKEGLNYLMSPDGRYLFQGALFDVWNGEQIESIGEMEKLSDRIDFKYIGVRPDRMFSLNIGTGKKEVFIFADPNCNICHSLIKDIRGSKLIKKSYNIRVVITPLLKKSSMDKAKKLAALAGKDMSAAIDAFIENSFENITLTEETVDGIDYNLLVAKALSIRNFPYLVNPQGRMYIGIPEEIHLFLSKQ
jgi:thiol:disulfide interchange protein DsbC